MNPEQVRETTGFRTGKVYTVDASHIASEEIGREITNTSVLGAFARETDLFAVEEMTAEQISLPESFSPAPCPFCLEFPYLYRPQL